MCPIFRDSGNQAEEQILEKQVTLTITLFGCLQQARHISLNSCNNPMKHEYHLQERENWDCEY